MATFAEIKTRVETRVIDLPAAITAEVGTLVNAAMKTLEQKHNFKVMQTETAQLVTTAASHTLAAVPTNWKEARLKPYIVENDGTTIKLTMATDRSAILSAFALSDTTDDGEPQAILEAEPTDDTGAASFEVYPFPDGLSDFSNGEYRIVIPYWRFVTALSADADTNWFTVHAEEYLVAMGASKGFLLDWDEPRAQLWQQERRRCW